MATSRAVPTMHDLSASQVAQLLRRHSATPHDQRRAIPIAHIATVANVCRLTVYRARLGYMGPRVRKALAYALQVLQADQVRPFAHSDPTEILRSITGFRT